MLIITIIRKGSAEMRLKMKKIITKEMLQEYKDFLRQEEKSEATIRKYLCDLGKLVKFAAGREIDKSS